MAANQQWALITGASAGLGRELCHCFARDKIGVIAVARSQDRLSSLCAELQAGYGTTNHAIPADLSTDAGVRVVTERVEALGLRVDFLVNNAGIGFCGRFDQLELKRGLATVDLNVRAMVQLCGHFAPKMVARGRGSILNISSLAGFQAGPYMSTYYASKAFVTSFSEGLYYELGPLGVRVTVSCPGPTHTEFAAGAGVQDKNLFDSKSVAQAADVARAAYRSMRAGKRMEVVGVRNKMLRLAGQLGPRSWGIRVAGWMHKPAK